jgi:hypothetical protein
MTNTLSARQSEGAAFMEKNSFNQLPVLDGDSDSV